MKKILGAVFLVLLGVALGTRLGPRAEPTPTQAVGLVGESVSGPRASRPIQQETLPVITQVRSVQPARPVPETKDRFRGINVEEKTVTELEQEVGLLSRHASAEHRQDGWLIHVYEEDRVLLEAGIQDGDVITQESLDAQRNIPDRRFLVARIENLLHTIER